MLLLLSLWLFLYFLSYTLGAGIIRGTHNRSPAAVSTTETLLTGLIAMVAVLHLGSIFLPINYWSVVGMTGIAICINTWSVDKPMRKALACLIQLSRQPISWLLVVVIVLYAVQRTTNPDSGTYHLPAIRYAERFPAIPGLGNLFSRLAFNSSFFTVGAAFACTDLVGQTFFPLNGFLLLVFGLYGIQQLRQPVLSPPVWGLQFGTLSLGLFFLIRQTNSPTTDVWATILTLFIFLIWLREPKNNSPFRALLLIALVFTCLTVKLATLPLLLVIPLLAYQHRHRFHWKQAFWVMALGCLIIIPWLARNVILSGYLLFPLASLDLFSPDWKVAGNIAQYEQDVITFWARFHLNETEFDPAKLTWPFSRWFSWWWTHWWYWYNWPNRPMFILAALSPVLAGIQLVYFRSSAYRSLSVYAVALAGFLFWFLNAPEFRFGFAFIWTTAFIPISALLRRSLPPVLSLALVGLVLAGLLGYVVIDGSKQPGSLVTTLYLPQKLSHVDLQARHIHYGYRQTRSGLTVVVPNAPHEPCFDIEQPCTPFFFSDLELRGRHVTDGFRRHQTHADSLANATVHLVLN